MNKHESVGATDNIAITAEILNDSLLKVKGEVHFKGFDGSGKELFSFDQNNLVVSLGKQAICKLLGEGTADKIVTQFAVGTSNVAAALTDTSPLTTQFKKAVAGFSYPTSTSVKFDWTLEFLQGNGLTINEFGLLCDDDTLFARVVAGPVVKTSAIRLVGSWIINFS